MSAPCTRKYRPFFLFRPAATIRRLPRSPQHVSRIPDPESGPPRGGRPRRQRHLATRRRRFRRPGPGQPRPQPRPRRRAGRAGLPGDPHPRQRPAGGQPDDPQRAGPRPGARPAARPGGRRPAGRPGLHDRAGAAQPAAPPAASRCRSCALLTLVEVDPADPAMREPSKFVGPAYAADEVEQLTRERGWRLKEDRGRGFRRVVASPRPRSASSRST